MKASIKRGKAFRSLKTLEFSSQLLGIFEFNNLKRRRRIIFNVYRCAVFIIILLAAVHEIPTMTFWITKHTGLHSILTLVQVILRWSILITNFLLNWIQNKKVSLILDKLHSFLIPLPMARTKKLNKHQAIHIISNLVVCFIYHIIGNVYIWSNIHYTWYTPIIYSVTEFHINYTNILFVHIIIYIKEHFKYINYQMSLIANSVNQNSLDIFQINYYKIDGKKEEIKKIRKLHLEICDVAHSINSCFSAQILLLVLLSIVEITYSLRSLVFHVMRTRDGGSWKKKPLAELVLTLFWSGLFCGNMFKLVYSCDQTIAESELISYGTHDAINKNKEKDVQNELLIFSQQLSQHKVRFRAGKLFTIRFSLIRTITGAILTYLVIIVTFKD